MFLQRVAPLATFGQLRDELDRLFADALPAVCGRPGAQSVGPLLNIREEAEQYRVEMDVPGLKMEDLNVGVNGNELTVGGKWSVEADDDDGHYLRRERASGEFSRSITLPMEINADKAEAVLKDGVMTITLPKSDVAKPRKILVRSEK
jgi:HSP20 family protein